MSARNLALYEMRILALSDIHGNIAAVTRMRERLANDYDLLIVAGDIDRSGTGAIFNPKFGGLGIFRGLRIIHFHMHETRFSALWGSPVG